MNAYLLLEGKRTEMKLYPQWFSILLPHFTRAYTPDEARANNYFLISGEGFPSLLDNHLRNSVLDINNNPHFDYFIIILDSEELTINEKIGEINTFIHREGIKINCNFRIVVQNRCIESWLLGNKKIFVRNPQSEKLKEYIDFYNVCQKDPELSGKHTDYETHAQFHYDYLRLIFNERNISYTKKNPHQAGSLPYFNQLIRRIRENNDHLQSFQTFLRICEELR
jgi:hypothetical protein